MAEGEMSFPLAVGAATAGSLAGNVALYVATPERLERLEAWMDRWGKATVLVARAVLLARSAVSLPAGLARFPFLPWILVARRRRGPAGGSSRAS